MFSTLFIKLFTQIVFCCGLAAVIDGVDEVEMVGVGATVATLTTLVSSPAESLGIEIV